MSVFVLLLFLNLLLSFIFFVFPPKNHHIKLEKKKKKIPPRSLPFLELGALQPLSRDLLPRATLSLRERADEARGELVAAVASSSAAAALLEGAASSLEAGIATIPLPVPVFATLGLPAIAGCFRRAADAQTQELERIRKRAVPAADAAVGEWRRAEEKRARQARAKTSSSNRSSSSSSSSSEALERLRSKLTVVIAAWKLQALLGPGAPPPPESGGRRGGGGGGSGGRALPVGAAGAGVAAELASVAAEMEGF